MKNLYILSIILLLTSCSIEPSKIEYGKDACHFCKMTIVEKKHAAQIVTKKGRDYKYDAIECLLNDLQERDKNDIALFLVTDYVKPMSLVDANLATYLISPEIKSPMGANLSAFSNSEEANKFLKSTKGKLYNWSEIQQKFSN